MPNKQKKKKIKHQRPTRQYGITKYAEKKSYHLTVQSVPGGKVDILWGHSIDRSKQKCLYEHVFPR